MLFGVEGVVPFDVLLSLLGALSLLPHTVDSAAQEVLEMTVLRLRAHDQLVGVDGAFVNHLVYRGWRRRVLRVGGGGARIVARIGRLQRPVELLDRGEGRLLLSAASHLLLRLVLYCFEQLLDRGEWRQLLSAAARLRSQSERFHTHGVLYCFEQLLDRGEWPQQLSAAARLRSQSELRFHTHGGAWRQGSQMFPSFQL
eukprot:4382227-Prymnesium_polylepis.3